MKWEQFSPDAFQIAWKDGDWIAMVSRMDDGRWAYACSPGQTLRFGFETAEAAMRAADAEMEEAERVAQRKIIPFRLP